MHHVSRKKNTTTSFTKNCHDNLSCTNKKSIRNKLLDQNRFPEEKNQDATCLRKKNKNIKKCLEDINQDKLSFLKK